MTTTRAYRLISDDYDEPTIGDVLPQSNVWDGDEETDEELPGTCAFATRAAVDEYAQWSHGWIVEIEGEQVATGDLPYEVIIADAVVMAVETK